MMTILSLFKSILFLQIKLKIKFMYENNCLLFIFCGWMESQKFKMQKLKSYVLGSKSQKIPTAENTRYTVYGNKLVNTIETKPLCISSSNLAEMLTLVRGWTLLVLEVRGQGHSGHVWKEAVNQIQTKLLCASSSNLADMLTMVNPIDFLGHSSMVKDTMGIILTNVGYAGILRLMLLYFIKLIVKLCLVLFSIIQRKKYSI